MNKATDMVGRLRQSVAEIMGSDAPDKDELLKKSFDQFEEAIASEADLEDEEYMDDEVDDGPVDPLEAFAAALAQADEIAAELIESGEIDPETAGLLDQWSAISDVALRAAVNTRAEPVFEEAELEAAKADGLGLFELPLAKMDGDADDAPEAVMVKSDLPPHLAQFITDPVALSDRMAELGLVMAKSVGVDVEGSGGGLRKFDPAMGEEGMEPAGMGDPAALAQQIQVLMRLNAAALVQGEQVMRQLAGDAEPEMEGAPEEEMADEGYAEDEEEANFADEGEEAAEDDTEEAAAEESEDAVEDEEDPRFARKSDRGELKKMVSEATEAAVKAAVEPLQKALSDAKAELNKARQTPAAPRGPVNTISKSVDNGGVTSDDQLKKIAELPEQERAVALMKLVHQNPIPVNG